MGIAGDTAEAPSRVVLVTGVSRGIGRSIAERLLSDGWEVHGTYRSGRDAAEKLASSHSGLSLHQVDLGAEGAVEGLAAELGDVHLDGLVNNAGVIHFEDMERFDVAPWRETIEINLTSAVHLVRALEDNLEGGSVVNIASTDATIGAYDSIAYSVSKAGLIAATRSLGNLLAATGIRVNAVSPGWIATEMTSEVEAATDLTPLGRIGSPAEVAAAVAWLLGPESSFVTGANLVIDGGYSNVDYVVKLEAFGPAEAGS